MGEREDASAVEKREVNADIMNEDSDEHVERTELRELQRVSLEAELSRETRTTQNGT